MADAPDNVAVGSINDASEAGSTVEVDDNDSTFSDDSNASETTSLASAIIKGHIENGRRYSSLREGYWAPSDEQHFETMDQAHFVYLIMRSEEQNLLFAAPIENPKRILDIGTGPGTWAIDTADKFPDAIVHGIDLFPPPNSWVPPNCFLEVDDAAKQWTWRNKFDLIHMRTLVGSFTEQEWKDLYKKIYDQLEPGGWIEHCEPDSHVESDDGTLDPDGYIKDWSPLFIGCSERAGRPIETINLMKNLIEDIGFINVHEQYWKLPIGAWPKNQKLKEAGRLNWHMWTGGLEGAALYLLTNFGSPKPWSKEEVMLWTSRVREEFKKPGQHLYHRIRRVWAQKPLDAPQ